jgi:hypothetical protein
MGVLLPKYKIVVVIYGFPTTFQKSCLMFVANSLMLFIFLFAGLQLSRSLV